MDFAAYNRSEHSEQRGGDYHGNADRLSIVSSPFLHFNNKLLDNNNNNTTTAGEDYHELKQVEIKTNYTDTPSS